MIAEGQEHEVRTLQMPHWTELHPAAEQPWLPGVMRRLAVVGWGTGTILGMHKAHMIWHLRTCTGDQESMEPSEAMMLMAP